MAVKICLTIPSISRCFGTMCGLERSVSTRRGTLGAPCVPPRTTLVSDMVQSEIVQHHCVPVVVLELLGDMPGDIVVDLGKVLPLSVLSTPSPAQERGTYRNEKARGSIQAVKCAGKQLQPSVVSVHEQLAGILCLHLSQPGVLGRQSGRLVALIEVENDVEEGWDGAGGDGLETGHGDGRRRCVCREGEGDTIADQAGAGHQSRSRPRGGEGGCWAYDCTYSKPLLGEYTKSLAPALAAIDKTASQGEALSPCHIVTFATHRRP